MRQVKGLKESWMLGDYLIELAELLESGVTLREGLELLASDDSRDPVEQGFRQIVTSMDEGIDLASSIESAFPKIPAFCTELIRQAGDRQELPSTLSRLGYYMGEMQSFNQKYAAIGKALLYPLFLLVTGLFILNLLMVFVVPQYEQLFSGFGAELPALTQSIIQLSSFLGDYWLSILSLMLLVIITWHYIFPQFRLTRRLRGIMLLQIPVINNLFRSGIEAQILSTLGLFAATKSTLLTALKATEQSFTTSYARDEITRANAKVQSGSTLADAFSDSRLFSNRFTKILRITERKGLTEGLLIRQADYNKRKLNNAPNLNRVLEPILIALLGLFIGYLVVAMYLPIFQVGAVM
ncbi:MAG: type II secretion system F family protein [Candidatus Thiodiazotropha sp.]